MHYFYLPNVLRFWMDIRQSNYIRTKKISANRTKVSIYWMSTDIKITHKQIYSEKAVRVNLMIHELPMTRPRNVSNGDRNVSKRNPTLQR